MNLIDWQELYAANRAVIEGHGGGPAVDLPTAPRPALPALPALTGRTGSAGGAALAGWERMSHHDGRRARPFFVHVPPDLDTATAAPLVVMLHGCTQSSASFAAATAMNAAADRHGFVVAYPEQGRDDNQQGCWNWFQTGQHARDGGEPAFIAGATRAVLDRWNVDPARVYVAGLSAGGAMASIMAATHPDLFAALAIHSGLAFGVARTLPSATAAMRHGADDPEALGRAAHAAMGHRARPVPALVLHGSADQVVCPVNGEHAARQWLETNRLASGGRFDAAFRRPTETSSDRAAGGRAVTSRRWEDRDGRPLAELVEVGGLGHAWSGGTPGGSHADPRGPSATDAIWDFFARDAGDARS